MTAQGVPKGDKTEKVDEDIRAIQQYLTTLQQLGELKDKALAGFLKHMSCYFAKGGKLWQHNPSGQHQLVIYYED